MSNKQLKLIVMFSIIFVLLTGGMAMSIPLQPEILGSTVLIKNQFGNLGTGFLISKNMDGGGQAIFLITNKHVLRENAIGPYSKYIEIRFYKKNNTSGTDQIKWLTLNIMNNGTDFNEIVFMHPEEFVDVVGILINPLIDKYRDEIKISTLNESLILTREKAKEELINAGEDVLIFGYPAGIFSESNYLPLIKSGTISSTTTEDLILTLGKDKEIKGKMYLIEAALFGGNSGGAVIIKPRWKARREKDSLKQTMLIGEGMTPYLLGIHSSSLQLKEKIYTRIISDMANKSISAQKNVKKIEKDDIGEYIELEKEILLNIVFSAEYIIDIFNDFTNRLRKNKNQSQGI